MSLRSGRKEKRDHEGGEEIVPLVLCRALEMGLLGVLAPWRTVKRIWPRAYD